ncbi:hypothetical protein [Desulfatiglans anilini]|uniref:hypothetical protein n=1 Tax=Desulfatiglans anilini TaxID=90728 RepID=UPI00137719CA|nr:hypothetical protein [Desulfatiglans anilini]
MRSGKASWIIWKLHDARGGGERKMLEFNGFDDWVEIFRGGVQMDKTGREHDGDTLIEQAVQSFDPRVHEPPIVVGHPADNAPAFGWVEKLKTATENGVKVLLAKFRQVVPEFEETVRKGLYKKRSASFYRDGRLRHVGFLGAAPPAVKGLADLAFEDQPQVAFEFEDINPKSGGTPMTFKEKLKNMLGFIGIDTSKVPDDALPDNPPEGTAARSFSEADLEAAARAAAEDAARKEREKIEAEFSEKTRQEAKSRRREEISAWCEKMVAEGRVLPSWAASGLKDFALALEEAAEIEFGESHEKKTPWEWFRDTMESFSHSPIFTELATKEKAGDAASFTEAKADAEKGRRIAAKTY